jgi:transcriptional adapter 3
MPPASSQKGTGKKGAGAIRQRSRNTTPSSVPPAANLPSADRIEVEYLELQAEVFRNLIYDDLVDQTASNAVIPDSKSLDGMIARLETLKEIIDRRTNFCDRSMRLLAQARKHHRMDEIVESKSQDERSRTDDEDREKRANKKKRKLVDALAPEEAKHGMVYFPFHPLNPFSTSSAFLHKFCFSQALSP